MREAGAAIMAKRRTNIMQSYAAEQVSRRHQMHSAEQLHWLRVKLEAFAAWRAFMQVS